LLSLASQVDGLQPDVAYHFRAKVSADKVNFGPFKVSPNVVTLSKPTILHVFSNADGSNNGTGSQSTMATNGGQLFTIRGTWLGVFAKTVAKVCSARVTAVPDMASASTKRVLREDGCGVGGCICFRFHFVLLSVCL
jgi:hypothetical protein